MNNHFVNVNKRLTKCADKVGRCNVHETLCILVVSLVLRTGFFVLGYVGPAVLIGVASVLEMRLPLFIRYVLARAGIFVLLYSLCVVLLFFPVFMSRRALVSRFFSSFVYRLIFRQIVGRVCRVFLGCFCRSIVGNILRLVFAVFSLRVGGFVFVFAGGYIPGVRQVVPSYALRPFCVDLLLRCV